MKASAKISSATLHQDPGPHGSTHPHGGWTCAKHTHLRVSQGHAALTEAGQAETVLASMTAGVVVLNKDGRVIQANAVAMEMLGLPLHHCVWRRVIERAFRQPAGHGVLLTDGRQIEVVTGPLAPSSHQSSGQVILLVDVSGSHIVQALHHRRDRLSCMGEMVASLAHQLRTPLSTAMLYNSSLLANPSLDLEGQAAVAHMRESLDRIEHMIRDMLGFVRGEETSMARVSLSTLFDALKRVMPPYFSEAGCALVMIDPGCPGDIMGNQDALLGMLQNLLFNALQSCQRHQAANGQQAKPESRHYRVQLSARIVIPHDGHEQVELCVHDNGSGIASGHTERVFEPFFTSHPQGTGLGLAVVAATVANHRGSVWCESNADQGATFYVRLPLWSLASGPVLDTDLTVSMQVAS